MFRRMLTYFFPPKKPRDNIALLPLRYSSPHGHNTIPPHYRHWIKILKLKSLARTDADAMRLIKRYKGNDLDQLIRIVTRKRRYFGKFKLAWFRLRRIW
jgi:hypothetical protein